VIQTCPVAWRVDPTLWISADDGVPLVVDVGETVEGVELHSHKRGREREKERERARECKQL
jgi:hypothetical protein